MKKTAHLVSRPDHQVGDKVLGLCGEEWKVTTLWNDIPEDHPICRPCVDIALGALTEADLLIQSARIVNVMLGRNLERITDILEPDVLILDQIAEDDETHRSDQVLKAERKAAKKRAKRTCTCEWDKTQIVAVDPNCPIHGDLEPKKVERGPGGRPVEDVDLPDDPPDTGVPMIDK